METGAESIRPSGWWRLAREALPLLVVLTVAQKVTFDEWRVRDLTMTDETLMYQGAAWHLSEWGVPAAEFSPLYVLWYRALMWLPVTPEYLLFVSHGVLLALVACSFYALVRRLGVGRWVGVAAVALLVLNTRMAGVEPYPMHLATVLFTTGVLAGTYRRTLLGAAGPVGFGILAACYVRPEFGTLLMAFLPVYLAAGVRACVRGAGQRREFLPWALPLTLAVAVCAWTVGLPRPSGERAIFAFGQHYARNVAETRGGGPEVWTAHWMRVVYEEFGEVRTVGDAIRARPSAVAWHVRRNLDRLPGIVVRLCRPELGLPTTPRTAVDVLVLVGVLAGVIGLTRRVRGGGLRGAEGQPLRVVLLSVACVAVVTGPSVVLVYPREHYLLLPLFFLLALVVSGLPAPRWPERLVIPTAWRVRAAGLVVAVLLVGISPTPVHGWTLFGSRQTTGAVPNLEQRETMILLRTLPRRPGPVVVMDYAHYALVRTLWMPRPVTTIQHDWKTEPFGAFVAKHDIGVIVLDRLLLADERFAGDSAFMALWDGTNTGSFVVLSSPGGMRVAVRKDLLLPD